MAIGLNGLAHECNIICNEINILEITNNNILSKRQIKSAVQKAITEQNRNNMLSFKKVADRVSGNSSDDNYLDRMGLTQSRIWIRYRARAIKGIKANHKRSWKNDRNGGVWQSGISKSLAEYVQCYSALSMYSHL